MKIVISSGHGRYVRGASGPKPWGLDEVNEARSVVEAVSLLWIKNGVEVDAFHDNISSTQSQNLQTIVNYHNSRTRDLDVSVHFNAYQVTSGPRGCEVLYVTQKDLSAKVSSAIASSGGFINRGAKKRTDLYFLNSTNKPAILIETCFVDSETDARLYRQSFDEICESIAESVAGITIGAPTEPPVEPPTDPDPVEPPAEVANVSISIQVSGPVTLTINGQDFIAGEPDNPEIPSTPVFAANHSNIVCTVFGGSSDPNDSAYPPFTGITDTEMSCALPYKWAGERPMVEVFNPDTGKTAICQIRDVGPWLTNDEAYVMGDDRPLAENPIIPSGPNAGKVSNGAGIDLAPAAAKSIGLSGKGMVHWRFI